LRPASARGFAGDGCREDSPLHRHVRDLERLVVPALLDIDTTAEAYGRRVLGRLIEDRLI
jgi:hypothetical protein